MALDFITLSAANSYTDEVFQGGGISAGKNCIISSIEPIENGNRVTFSYTLDDGTEKTSLMDVMNGEQGISVVSANVDSDNLLTFTLSNGETIEAGTIVIDSSELDLDNYYNKTQADEKFVQKIELSSLIRDEINNMITTIPNEDIYQLFSQE